MFNQAKLLSSVASFYLLSSKDSLGVVEQKPAVCKYFKKVLEG